MIDSAFCGVRAGAFGDVALDVFIGVFSSRRKVSVSFAFVEEFLRGRSVLRGVRRLKNDFFVVIQSEPFESFDDGARRCFGRALRVRIFDAQQKKAAGLFGVKIIEESRARRADVQIARWRRSEANACLGHKEKYKRKKAEG